MLLSECMHLFSESEAGVGAQADSKEKHVKDLAVVLGTETATIILDDTISVWPEHQHNLMQVVSAPTLCKFPCNICIGTDDCAGCCQRQTACKRHD